MKFTSEVAIELFIIRVRHDKPAANGKPYHPFKDNGPTLFWVTSNESGATGNECEFSDGFAGDILTLLESEREARRLR